MTKSSIKTINLSKKYNKKNILKNISMELPEKGIFGILGKNGAGKTTLLAMLMGLITPTCGDIFIFNKSLKNNKYEILEKMNFQSPYVELPKKMSVSQNLEFYARLYNVRNPSSIISQLSEDLRIKDLLENNYGNLSSGQKTRVNLCKALLNKPKLLLLDEPTASLDVYTSEFIRKYLLKFQKLNNSSIIITSHDVVEIDKMCSYIIILDNGSLLYKGKKDSFMTQNNYSSLKDLFFS